jgi:hypothetical protein
LARSLNALGSALLIDISGAYTTAMAAIREVDWDKAKETTDLKPNLNSESAI